MTSAGAVDIYSTGFDNPPFVAGANTWAGTEGWLSSDTSSSIQGILGDPTSGQTAYLGYNPPADSNNFVWKIFNYDPIAQQNPVVDIGIDVAIVDSSNSRYDRFEIQIENTAGALLGSIYLDNADLHIWRSDGVTYTDTGVKFTNNAFFRLSAKINYATNTWSAILNSTPLFTNVPFHAGASGLNMGWLAYAWRLATPGSPGNNYLVTDNLSLKAGPGGPVVINPTSSSVTHNSAVLGGNISSDGGSAVTERGVVCSLSNANTDPVIGGPGVTKVVGGATSVGVFSVPINGLMATTRYCYKAYATNSVGTSYTSVDSFTTSLHPEAVSLYTTGFANPPFASGANTWVGTDGWQGSGTNAGNQGITVTQAFLGFNLPSANSAFVWKPLNYDPIAQQHPVVDVCMDLGVMDSTNGQRDRFGVQIYNASDVPLGGIYLSNADQHIWRSDGVTTVDTGMTFSRNTLPRLAFSVNFSTNKWTASLDGVPVFTDVTFHGGTGVLNLGDLTYTWLVLTPGSPGDNYLLTDNLSISARPFILLPAITAASSTAVTYSTATLGGNITSNGGASLIERGVVYSIASANNNPAIGGTGVTKVAASGTAIGVFTAPVSGLVASKIYAFKAYATNSVGTSYTNAGSFTTGPEPAPGDLDPLTLVFTGGQTVSHIVPQPDGKTLIAGNFVSVAGVTRRCIARLNLDWTLDAGFNPNVIDGEISCMILQDDGKVLICGSFTTLQPNGAASPTVRNRIARLNPDGTLDSFNPSANNVVNTIALQSDNKVLLGGSFTALQPNGATSSTTRNRIARVNADGTLDAGFNPNANSPVRSIVVQRDGMVLLGGQFTTLTPNGAVAPVSRNYIARVDSNGLMDTAFNPNADNFVFCMAVQPDDKILVGGRFTAMQPNGSGLVTQRRFVARLIANGTLDSGFAPDPSGVTPNVSCLAMQWDGKILLGGYFTTLQPNGGSSISRRFIARVTGGGAVDAFNPAADDSVVCISLQMDGKVLMGGAFTSLKPNGAAIATSRNGFARLINDPATTVLAVPTSTEAVWNLTGTGPEFSSVTYEFSSDGGTTWSKLGAGERITGGWRIGNLSLSGNGKIRARGRTSSSGSSGLVEQVAEFGFASPFDTFVTGFGLDPQTTGAPGFDNDHDGIPNLLEYLLGGNPVVANTGILPSLTTIPADGGHNLVFTYKRKISAAGIIQVIEHSTNLSNTWDAAVHGQNGVTIITATVPGDATAEQVTVTIPSTSARRFVRLRANQ